LNKFIKTLIKNGLYKLSDDLLYGVIIIKNFSVLFVTMYLILTSVIINTIYNSQININNSEYNSIDMPSEFRIRYEYYDVASDEDKKKFFSMLANHFVSKKRFMSYNTYLNGAILYSLTISNTIKIPTAFLERFRGIGENIYVYRIGARDIELPYTITTTRYYLIRKWIQYKDIKVNEWVNAYATTRIFTSDDIVVEDSMSRDEIKNTYISNNYEAIDEYENMKFYGLMGWRYNNFIKKKNDPIHLIEELSFTKYLNIETYKTAFPNLIMNERGMAELFTFYPKIKNIANPSNMRETEPQNPFDNDN
jgi:hypothetical protein